MLQSGERDRARKEFVDATRAKVLSAAQRHVEERRKKEENSITPGQAPTPAPPPPPAHVLLADGAAYVPTNA